MSKKLTHKNSTETKGVKLADKVNSPFIISFKDKLPNTYNFSQCKEKDIKLFQSFLDKVSNMTVGQVDKLFLRKPDKTDKSEDKQIQHYEISKSFRIHGTFESGHFYILRIDPKHSFHK